MDLSWMWLLFLWPLVAQLELLTGKMRRADNAEFYEFKGLTYGVYRDLVTFLEAKVVCESLQGSLVEFHDESVALFLGRALAESSVGFSPLWIGGVYSYRPNQTFVQSRSKHRLPEFGVWEWLSGEPINKEHLPRRTVFPMDRLPFWMDRPNLTVNHPLCLVTDRKDHVTPLITGESCNNLRPFVCTLPTESFASGPVEVLPPIELDSKTYRLYHARYTWIEALRFCRGLKYRLAMVSTANEFEKLQRRMQRARPVMENAWIGATLIAGRWTWVTTSQEVVPPAPPANATAPPWAQPTGEGGEGCLLADRHLCDYYTYVEAKCDRRRSFVCEMPHAQEERIGLMRIPNSSLWISTMQLDWEEAQRVCTRCVAGSLMQLWFYISHHLQQQMKDVFTGMTQSGRADIRHIWINGYLTSSSNFVWGNDRKWDGPAPEASLFNGNKVGFHNSLDPKQWNFTSKGFNRHGEQGFILFCPGDLRGDPDLKEFQCLNMDREDMKHYYMYGLDCRVKQHFICMPYGEVVDGVSYFTSNATRPHLSQSCKSWELEWAGV